MYLLVIKHYRYEFCEYVYSAQLFASNKEVPRTTVFTVKLKSECASQVLRNSMTSLNKYLVRHRFSFLNTVYIVCSICHRKLFFGNPVFLITYWEYTILIQFYPTIWRTQKNIIYCSPLCVPVCARPLQSS